VFFSNGGQGKMATLSELVNTIAAVEGIEPATVNLIARYVREAGLISTGGRGSSAAAMGLTDAANLLIGVNATTTATESARTVSACRGLEAWARSNRRPAMQYGTLGEAIEQLLYATGIGELPERFLNRGIPSNLQEAFSTGDVEIQLSFRRSGSRLSAILRIAPLPGSAPATADGWQLGAESGHSILFAFNAPRSRGPPEKKKDMTADRIVETTIGYRTLNAVGKLLQPDG
jgi:hypothetical protein